MYFACITLIIVTFSAVSLGEHAVSGFGPHDYILISQETNITRINLGNGVVEQLPISDLIAVGAIEFDIVNSCVFWYDTGHNVICRQCMGGVVRAPEVLASVDIGSVNSLAYDWMSELLYFIDDVRQVIDVIKTSARASAATNRWQRTIISIDENSLARGMAVHPSRGFLFWAELLKIYRSDLDGGNVRLIVDETQLVMVKSIVVDHAGDRVYWLDIYRGSVGSCNMDGRNCEQDEDGSVLQSAWGFAVFKDYVFWSDVQQQSVSMAKKGCNITY